MTDKSWMLNPTAIAQARNCITIIQTELGIKLKLSHPQFLELILEYIELTDSQALNEAYTILSGYADSELPQSSESSVLNKSKIANITPPSMAVKPEPATQTDASEEMIIHRGKAYRKYSDTGEFKGLYRGQARYA